MKSKFIMLIFVKLLYLRSSLYKLESDLNKSVSINLNPHLVYNYDIKNLGDTKYSVK